MKKMCMVAMMLVSVIILSINADAAIYGLSDGDEYVYFTGMSKQGSCYDLYKGKQRGVYMYDHYKYKLMDPVYHKKGSGDDVLMVTRTATYSSQETQSWTANASVSTSAKAGGAFIPFETSVSVSVSAGYGESRSKSFSYAYGSTVSKVIKDNANTGYYTRMVGQTYYRVKSKYGLIKNGKYIPLNDYYFKMPYGSCAIYTMYSKYNETYKIY